MVLSPVASRQFADLCDAMAVRHRHGFFWILFKQGRAGVGVLTDVFFPSLTMEDLKTGKFSPAGAERPRLVFKKIHTIYVTSNLWTHA